MREEHSHISTYPVGILAAIKHRKIRSLLRYLKSQAQARNWRAVRNSFNGYLAEWHYPPEGMIYHRCGKGWTRKRAIRRLGIHIATVNAPEIKEATND